MNDLKPSCIVLDSDYTGEHNARMGVAEWLGGAIQKISIEEARKYLLQKEKDQASLNADILIGGTGEDTTELVLDLAKSMKQPLTIFLASILPDQLDQRIHDYDLVVGPPHDELTGTHVLTLLGVPHRLRPEKIAKIAPPTPVEGKKIAFLMGGNTRYCDGFTPEYAQRLGTRISRQARKLDAKIIVTNSRRTPAESLAAFRKEIAPFENAFIDWQDSDPTTYFKILAEADLIICTGDSLSMCCEAAISGKALLVTTDTEAMESYHIITIQRLIEAGYALEFCGDIEAWPQPTKRLDPTALTGTRILELLSNRKGCFQ
jgi:uncharacterized protein